MIFSVFGSIAFSNVGANGVGESKAAILIIGASKYSNAFSEILAAISPAKPQLKWLHALLTLYWFFLLKLIPSLHQKVLKF